jgi:hypothetical protein
MDSEDLRRHAASYRERVAPNARVRFPWGIVALLVPSWITFLVLPDRDTFDTENPLYFHPPNLTEEPLRTLGQLLYTPFVNTEFDQILLVTGLLLLFGVPFELRCGTWQAIAVFGIATTVAAVFGAALLHLLYPLFPDVHMFADGGWNRVFHGGSAGGWGLMAAFAATTRHPWIWLVGFVAWEGAWWVLLTGDYTPVFHATTVVTGYVVTRWFMCRWWPEVRET